MLVSGHGQLEEGGDHSLNRCHLQRYVPRVERLKTQLDPTLSLAQIALRFCLSHPAITTVIPGVRNSEQVIQNLAVAQQAALPSDLYDRIIDLWHDEFSHNVRTSIGEEDEGYKWFKLLDEMSQF